MLLVFPTASTIRKGNSKECETCPFISDGFLSRPFTVKTQDKFTSRSRRLLVPHPKILFTCGRCESTSNTPAESDIGQTKHALRERFRQHRRVMHFFLRDTNWQTSNSTTLIYRLWKRESIRTARKSFYRQSKRVSFPNSWVKPFTLWL